MSHCKNCPGVEEAGLQQVHLPGAVARRSAPGVPSQHLLQHVPVAAAQGGVAQGQDAHQRRVAPSTGDACGATSCWRG